MLIFVGAVLVLNLIVDILLGIIDPRSRTGGTDAPAPCPRSATGIVAFAIILVLIRAPRSSAPRSSSRRHRAIDIAQRLAATVDGAHSSAPTSSGATCSHAPCSPRACRWSARCTPAGSRSSSASRSALLACRIRAALTSGFQSVVQIAIAFPAILTAMFVGTVIGIGVPGAVIGVGIAMVPIFARLTQTLTWAAWWRSSYVAAALHDGHPRRRRWSRGTSSSNVAEPPGHPGRRPALGICAAGISALSFLGPRARPPSSTTGAGCSAPASRPSTISPLAAIAPGGVIARVAGVAFSLLGEAMAGSCGENQASRAMRTESRSRWPRSPSRPHPVPTHAGSVPSARTSSTCASASRPSTGELRRRCAALTVLACGRGAGRHRGRVGVRQERHASWRSPQLVEYPAVVTADRIALR